MAHPLPHGLVPSEAAFLCEMELVTVVPRQRLDPIKLLGGETPALRPPHRAVLPLWLALLLKRQRRCSIVAPPWLHPASLQELVVLETRDTGDTDGGGNLTFTPPPPAPVRSDGRGNARRVADRNPFSRSDIPLSPPFLPSCTAEAPAGFLPYHWFEMAEILLAHAPDDLPAPVGDVRALLRDLAEARAAKVRALSTLQNATRGSDDDAAPALVSVRGIGAMELAEVRGLVGAVHDGVRKLGAAAEASRREEEEAMGGGGGDAGGRGSGNGYGDYDDEDSDDDMGI